jgi:hypothetical protein
MMKRILLSGTIFLVLKSFAQEPADALRYSLLTPSGTARSMATGGALTSLGGDLTSTFVNPAGIALYKTGELVFSPGFTLNNNKSKYLGTTEKDNKNNFNFGTSGIIFATPGSGRSNWRNFSYSIAYNRTANFNNSYAFRGKNDISSYSEKYLEELINNNVTDPNAAAKDFPFGSSLAFNTYLIDTINNNGNVTGYRSLATPQTGVNQEQQITTKGGISTIGFAGSANLGDKLYLGASLGIDILNFEKNSTYTESDATANSANNFNNFNVNETLETKGTGINLKLGLIYKPVEYLRLGIAFHSPTFYELQDKYTTTVTTDLEGYAGPGKFTQSSNDLVGQPGEFQYSFTNPWRVMGGVSYVFREVKDVTKQRAFISADVEYVNYASSSFSESGTTSSGYFSELNKTVDNQLTSAFNFKLGGELKFNTWMFRGGFGYFSNPYKDKTVSASKMNISGGLGYRDKGKFVDLTYVHQLVKNVYYPYRLEGNEFFPVNVNGSVGNIILTIGFKF